MKFLILYCWVVKQYKKTQCVFCIVGSLKSIFIHVRKPLRQLIFNLIKIGTKDNNQFFIFTQILTTCVNTRVISHFKTTTPMKKILPILITFFSITVFGQTYSEVMNNQMTFEKWEKESKTNIRLLPKYGNAVKTEEQKKLDQELIETSLKIDGTNRKASDHMIQVGFSYIYRDIKTAMYRFNQAFLLDSTNSDIYWGYGGVYMVLRNYDLAKKQYLEGLKINPNNPHLLTDYGTYFMIQYSNLLEVSKKDAIENLQLAIQTFNKSYELDPNDQNTLYKLSVAYYTDGNCKNATLFLDKCKALGGKPIDKGYESELKKKCKK